MGTPANALDITQVGLVQFDGVNAFTGVAPSTSGNIATSNGSVWISQAPVGTITTVTRVLTSAEIKALRATPIQLIAAPGAGKAIIIVSATAKFIYGGTNVFVAAASQKIDIYYANTLTAAIGITNGLVPNTALVATNDKYSTITGQGTASFLGQNPGIIDNVNVAAYQSGSATEISGNAANNNTISITVSYYTVTF
jgi:hypothetical protein